MSRYLEIQSRPEAAGSLVARLIRASAELRQIVDTGEDWTYNSGNYRTPFGGDEHLSTSEDNGELVGMERTVRDQIVETHIDKKRKNKGPVVAVDFGGMFGMSFNRIAHDLGKLIDKKEVVLVVTNLTDRVAGLVAKKKIPRQGYRVGSMKGLVPEEAELIEQNWGLGRVRYLTTDGRKLRKVRIDSGNGEMALGEKVDVLVENHVLMHGVVNDLDLDAVGASMSEEGIIFLGTELIQGHDYAFPGGDKLDEKRQEAHQIGQQNLIRRGFRKIECDANFQVFAAREARLIQEIDDKKGTGWRLFRR